MEDNCDESDDYFSLRFLLAAFAVVATLAFVSGAAFGSDQGAVLRVDRTELRIADMNARLMITMVEEEQWGRRQIPWSEMVRATKVPRA